MSVKQHIEKAEEFKERGEEEIKIAVDHLEKAVQNFRIAAFHFQAALAAENIIDPKEFAKQEAQLKRKKVRKK